MKINDVLALTAKYRFAFRFHNSWTVISGSMKFVTLRNRKYVYRICVILCVTKCHCWGQGERPGPWGALVISFWGAQHNCLIKQFGSAVCHRIKRPAYFEQIARFLIKNVIYATRSSKDICIPIPMIFVPDVHRLYRLYSLSCIPMLMHHISRIITLLCE
jgi:hypothetical protein